MKNFEKDLRNATLPDVRVDVFKRTLRRNLLDSLQAARAPRRNLALGLASAAAVSFALLLVVFVLNPEIPARLHAAVVPGAPAINQAEFSPGDLEITNLLSQMNATPEVDQAFLESWYRQHSRPVEVKAVGGEKLLALRQFELANGERVVVLTEIGGRPKSPTPAVLVGNRTF